MIIREDGSMTLPKAITKPVLETMRIDVDRPSLENVPSKHDSMVKLVAEMLDIPWKKGTLVRIKRDYFYEGLTSTVRPGMIGTVFYDNAVDSPIILFLEYGIESGKKIPHNFLIKMQKANWFIRKFYRVYDTCIVKIENFKLRRDYFSRPAREA